MWQDNCCSLKFIYLNFKQSMTDPKADNNLFNLSNLNGNHSSESTNNPPRGFNKDQNANKEAQTYSQIKAHNSTKSDNNPTVKEGKVINYIEDLNFDI